MKELILGSGNTTNKKRVISPLSNDNEFKNPITCDMNKLHKPDIVHDLNILPWPFEDNSFDEIHAYNILEHLGQQGDFKSFFAHFEEMSRILIPGGYICGISVDFDTVHLWGDPGHTRAITRHMLRTFLSQELYELRDGKSPITDYRFIYKADFEYIPLENDQIGEEPEWSNFAFLLKVFKPARFIKIQT
jgi:SAM-dependent methyltransferase